MLKTLHVENFKSWATADLVFGKITVIAHPLPMPDGRAPRI
jgi:hypothetical protein